MSDSAGEASGRGVAWCLNPRVQLRWRHLSGEWLIFEVLSGQTHHVDPVAAVVLTCFESGEALSAHDLADRLEADYGAVMTDAQKSAAVTAHLQWVALGILVTATQDAFVHAAV